jgi:hypothetical protein
MSARWLRALVLAAAIGTFVLLGLALLTTGHARPASDQLPVEPQSNRAAVREQLCLSDFRAAERDGGTTPHALRCYLRYRR